MKQLHLTGLALALLGACAAPEPQPAREAGSEAPGATAPAAPAISRIAFGSCAFQWAEQPIFRAVAAIDVEGGGVFDVAIPLVTLAPPANPDDRGDS